MEENIKTMMNNHRDEAKKSLDELSKAYIKDCTCYAESYIREIFWWEGYKAHAQLVKREIEK